MTHAASCAVVQIVFGSLASVRFHLQLLFVHSHYCHDHLDDHLTKNDNIVTTTTFAIMHAAIIYVTA